jgi:hypothetical protein
MDGNGVCPLYEPGHVTPRVGKSRVYSRMSEFTSGA